MIIKRKSKQALPSIVFLFLLYNKSEINARIIQLWFCDNLYDKIKIWILMLIGFVVFKFKNSWIYRLESRNLSFLSWFSEWWLYLWYFLIFCEHLFYQLVVLNSFWKNITFSGLNVPQSVWKFWRIFLNA